MRPQPQDPDQLPRCVQGHSRSGTFHHQQTTSALAHLPAWHGPAPRGAWAGPLCSVSTQRQDPQPRGLGKLGVGMVLQGGSDPSCISALPSSARESLCVLGRCRALGRCPTLAHAAWSLVSWGTKRDRRVPATPCLHLGWTEGGSSRHRPAGGDGHTLTALHAKCLALAALGPGLCTWGSPEPPAPQGQVPGTKARVGWGRPAIQPFPGLYWATQRC